MVSARWSCFAFALWSSATLSAQNPVLETTNPPSQLEPSSVATVPSEPLTPEKRGDILMARKMYREAAETYKEVKPDSAVMQNKIGIAYHQMLKLDIAKRYYERAVKLDPKYAEAINNLGTVYYS